MYTLSQKKWSWRVMTFLAVLIAIVAVLPYITLNRANFAPVFEGRFMDQSVLWLYLHIFTGGIALLTGSFQFWVWFRNKYRNAHRWLGRIYLFLGIFPSSIAGIVIAFGTVSGWTGTLGFSLLGIFWFSTGAMALYKIKNKHVQEHRRWMIRNFSLTLAAVTLRLWIPILIMIFIPLGVDPDNAFDLAYSFVPWLSWVPNILIAEYIIRTGTAKQVSTGNLKMDEAQLTR